MTSRSLTRLVFVLAGVLALSSLAPAQVVFYHPDSNPATGGGPNLFPFNQLTGFSSLHFYTADQLQAQGVAPGATLTDMAFASGTSAAVSGTYNSPNSRFMIGHVTAPGDLTPGAWTTTLDTPTVIHDSTVSATPYTFPWTPSSWVPLPGVAAAGFVWDGQRDIGIFYTSSSSVTGGINCRTSLTNGRFGVTAYNALAQPPTTTGFFAMKIRLTFTGVLPQANTPQATMTVNGSSSATHLAGTEVLSLSLSSTTAAGNPFFLLISPSFTGGHLPLSGQSFDLGYAPAGFADVLVATPGGFFPFLTGPFVPWGTLDGSGNYSLNLPLGCGAPIAKTFIQGAIIDPGHPDGVRITAQPSVDAKAACRFSSGSAFPIAIPDGPAGPAVTATIVVAPGTTIADLDVLVNITHTYFGDLTMTLDLNGLPIATLMLANSPADSSDLGGIYHLSDEAPITFDVGSTTSLTTIVASRFSPDTPLSVFDGLDAGGTWTLTVQDLVALDVGTINNFQILVNGTE